MAPKLFEDDDDDSSQNEDISKIEVDENYGRRLEYNRTRQDLQKYEERKKRGDISSSDDSDESSEEYEPDEDFGNPVKDLKFFDSLIKVRRQDPSLKNKDVMLFGSDEEGGEDESDEEGKKDEKDANKEKKKKKKKKMLLKDVQAKHLMEEGPDFDVSVEEKVKTYAEEQEELRKALLDAVEEAEAEDDDDGEDLLTVKESKSENLEEVDDVFVKKVDEYFGEGAELDENTKFLRDFFTKQMWKEKDGKGKKALMDEDILDELEQDEGELERQEEYETNFRHEEEDAGALKNYPRKVEDSVRNKENPRKAQRKNKEERLRIAEMERQEELKRLKNVKKKEIKEKMKKVLSIAGFKEGDECPINPKDLDDEFDPDEYDKMMKAVFDDEYYGEDDSGFGNEEDEDEKPDFEKEDELLGLPKNWDVIKPGDGFLAAREKTLQQKEDDIGDEELDEGAEEEEEEEEEKEGEELREENTESKRKRKRKASLVQRAKEALMEEYYKLEYEDTIGDLKTRFKYAKVEPNRFGLETEEVLALDDRELNQFVSLKKIAPYKEKEWKLPKTKKHEQKLKIKELLRDKKSGHKNKKKPKSEEKKKQTVEEGGEEGKDDQSKLSRKAKRRRRQSELKPSHSRLVGYQKAGDNTSTKR
ncbi:PREDICTED: protein KRI1 homolog [Tarenaya hassleriana]|uniref:protein KRI1 homolog n=1 Tax=Tarenaya hassleriana TaxID=28532 RepID=UPI00053C6519|nr:PREDICTED: protein KRI1 homolog [Tarenaya hassleriana]